jgi:hypothetical protein
MAVTRILILLFVSFTFSSNVIAYPINPRPLRELVIESEFIIIGYVIKTYDKNEGKGGYNNKIAKIAILETLQGKIKEDTIEIAFNPNMICPSPDSYFDKTLVISFLDKTEKHGYRTHAYNYGAKTLKKDEIEIYKTRILEIKNILKIQNEKIQKKETIDWLLKCAENKATRWEGTYELKRKDESLSETQKERLKIALFNTKEEYLNFDIVDIIYKGNEKELDSFLLKKLKLLNIKNYWVASLFMNKLNHKKSNTEVQNIMTAFGEIQFDKKKTEGQKLLIDKFISFIEKVD